MRFDQYFWKKQYKDNKTGWDIGYISTPIKEYIDQLEDKDIKILVPGAGNAYEVEYLHQQGFYQVYLLDYVQDPIDAFLKNTPDFPKEHIINTDFFLHKGQYDLIIEQTFFSSLNPNKRQDYINQMHHLLSPKGKLVGLLFQIEFNNNFPPFGGNKEVYYSLFNEKFEIKKLETAYNSIKPRANNELFIIFEKK